MAHVNGELGPVTSAGEEVAAIADGLKALRARLAHLEKPTITNRELAAVSERVEKLEKISQQAEAEENARRARQEMNRAKKAGWMVVLTGALVWIVGSALIGGTVVLGTAAITGEADALSSGEFIAGVSAGCVLVLAVVALAATWISHSRPGRATL
ncbi:MAG TPA: hypothetical protein VK790_00405 [Solirubrobacteraceae bacterium]|nr:hypothetical protein [Solirubrobacteraceae bacterium]